MHERNETEKTFVSLQQGLMTYSINHLNEMKETWLNFSISEQKLGIFLEANSKAIFESKQPEGHFPEMMTGRLSAAQRLNFLFEQLSTSIGSILKVFENKPAGEDFNHIAECFRLLDTVIDRQNKDFKKAIKILALETAKHKKCHKWFTADTVKHPEKREKKERFEGDFVVCDPTSRSQLISAYLISPVQTLTRLPLLIKDFKTEFEKIQQKSIMLLKQSVCLTKEQEEKLKSFIFSLELALKFIDQSLKKVSRINTVINQYMDIFETQPLEDIDFSKIVEEALDLVDIDDFYIRYIGRESLKDPYQLSIKGVSVLVIDDRRVKLILPKTNTAAIYFFKTFSAQHPEQKFEEIKIDNQSFFELTILSRELYGIAAFLHATGGFFEKIDPAVEVSSELLIMKYIHKSGGTKNIQEKVAKKVFDEFEYKLRQTIEKYQQKHQNKNKPNWKLAENLICFMDKIKQSPKSSLSNHSYLSQLLFLVAHTSEAAKKNHQAKSLTGIRIPSLTTQLNECLSEFTEEKIKFLKNVAEREMQSGAIEKEEKKAIETVLMQIALEQAQKALALEKAALEKERAENAIKAAEIAEQKDKIEKLNADLNAKVEESEPFKTLTQTLEASKKMIKSQAKSIEKKKAKMQTKNKRLDIIKAINASQAFSGDLKSALIKIIFEHKTYLTLEQLTQMERLFGSLEMQTARFSGYLNAYCSHTSKSFFDKSVHFFSWVNHTQQGVNTAKKYMRQWDGRKSKRLNILGARLIEGVKDIVTPLEDTNSPIALSFEKMIYTAYAETLKAINKEAVGILNDPGNAKGKYRGHSAKTYLLTYIRENARIITVIETAVREGKMFRINDIDQFILENTCDAVFHTSAISIQPYCDLAREDYAQKLKMI